MTLLLIFKVITAPLLILGLTLLIRRYGPVVGGLAMGVPLITGPVSVFTALEHGPTFAAHAAAGNLVGQISTGTFCLAYTWSAQRLKPGPSVALGIAAFAAATVLWSGVQWSLWPAALLLMVSLMILSRLMPRDGAQVALRKAPTWELPVRMGVAASFVVGLTALTGYLGPQWSGLIAPFPVFVLILAVFTHLREGGGAAARLLQGVILGSWSFGTFFVVVGLGLGSGSLTLTYGLAAGASLITSTAGYLAIHRQTRLTKR